MKMMGIVFSNIYDERLGALTKHRTLASIPYGGRYRLCDFVLSNFVNSGITNVGIITKMNYQSLMDHLGSGKEWDLDRKKDGLFILPPFGTKQAIIYKGKLEALQSALIYLTRSSEEYVVISDSNVICNIDYDKILKFHIDKKADITLVCTNNDMLSDEERSSERSPEISDRTNTSICSDVHNKKDLVIGYDAGNKVNDVLLKTEIVNNYCYSLGMFIMKRELLIRLIEEGASYNRYDFNADIVQRKYNDLNMYAYNFEGTALYIENERTYFKANMKLLDKDIRREIFSENGPIYTKVRDEVPVFYAANSNADNSFIADGCRINGEVENSILFRGVIVEKGAKIKNSIIMQDTHIGKDVFLNYVIADKDVFIGDGRMLMGALDYPVIIDKGSNL